MTKQEAIEAMEAGFKVTHRFFSDSEFIEMPNPPTVKDENEYGCNLDYWFLFREGEAWENDWSIYKDEK